MTPDLSRHRPLIEAALRRSRGEGSYEDVKQEIAAGRAHLWSGKQSVAITQFHEHRSLHVWLAAGEREELKFMNESAAEFARSVGANVMTAEDARPGWKRVMKDLGWREVRLLIRDIDRG